MTFQRYYDRELGEYIINRELTGPPPPPNPGVIIEEDGVVVGDSSSINVPPPTVVSVNLPGPREPLLDAQGLISPRWYRFLQELYQRTGGVNDNVNNIERYLTGVGTTGSIAFATDAPSAEIDHSKGPGVTSVAFASAAPTVSIA